MKRCNLILSNAHEAGKGLMNREKYSRHSVQSIYVRATHGSALVQSVSFEENTSDVVSHAHRCK